MVRLWGRPVIRHEGRKGERGDRGVRKMGLGGDGSPPPYLVSVQWSKLSGQRKKKKKVEKLGRGSGRITFGLVDFDQMSKTIIFENWPKCYLRGRGRLKILLTILSTQHTECDFEVE